MKVRIPFLGALLKKRGSRTHIPSEFRTGPRPRRDWTILLVLAALGLVFIGAGGFYLFTQYPNVPPAEDEDGSAVSVDEGRLKDTAKHYRQRKEMFKARLLDPPSLVDPSI